MKNLLLLFAALNSRAAEPIPSWLATHVGTGEDEIAPVVLERARALYQEKVKSGKVKNPCYMAMDATRPHQVSDGKAGNRFYVICEGQGSFRAISSGHGSGLKLPGLSISNEKTCVKNFSNANGSLLTMGGPYVTAETITSFKGIVKVQGTELNRSFVAFDGEGETANSRDRDIGGHPSVLLADMCWRHDPTNPHADKDGDVAAGELEDYTDGRSNGCTSWSPKDAAAILQLLKDDPSTVYIYPESADIRAVAQAAAEGKDLAQLGLYWNKNCLKEIQQPAFWPKETLEPAIAKLKADAAPKTTSLPPPGKKYCSTPAAPAKPAAPAVDESSPPQSPPRGEIAPAY